MAELVIGYGKSGAGKTTAICSLPERSVLIYQCEAKRLPTKKQFPYLMKYNWTKTFGDNIKTLKSALLRMPTKAAVIDDLTYIMTNMFMAGHRNKKGGSSFDLYDDIADTIWDLFRFIKYDLPDDVIVYIMMHEDTNDYGDTKLRTIGRLLDNKVCLEGMVTICLRYMSDMGRHYIKTVTDGRDITKAPMGMFDKDEIPNDLALVDSTIREYYGIAPIIEISNDNNTDTTKQEETA